ESPDVDALLFVHPLAEEDEGIGLDSVTLFAEYSKKINKPFIVSNCATSLGDWATPVIEAFPGVATGRGPRSTLRGLQTLGDFVRARAAISEEPETVAPLE